MIQFTHATLQRNAPITGQSHRFSHGNTQISQTQSPAFKVQGGPPGHFTRVLYFYNHARRLRLEKLLYLELTTRTVEVPTDFLTTSGSRWPFRF
jgi:hypothetical protein